MKIVIVSGIQIINNPRVVKEANVLSRAGYDVVVIGAILDKHSKKRIQSIVDKAAWRHIPVIDSSGNHLLPKLDYYYARLKRKISFSLKKWLNIESPNQLGYFVKRLLKISNRCNADLYIVHLEQAMWVGKELIKNGRRVAIDMEDWYSEDGLPEDRLFRPTNLLSECECYLLNNSAYAITTSKSLSFSLKNRYYCPLPRVVYNSFPSEDKCLVDGKLLDRKNHEIPSIIWFSQTIGPGRGLEELISALNDVDSLFELHLRGSDSRDFFRVLIASASPAIRDKIFIHPQVPQEELLSRLCEHDIGYCGDLSDCLSRDLTITNKMMEYLRAGLAIVASDTTGHKEINQMTPGVINIFKQNNIKSLVSAFELFLIDNKRLMFAKQISMKSLDDDLSWERSGGKLVELVSNCFSDSNRKTT